MPAARRVRQQRPALLSATAVGRRRCPPPLSGFAAGTDRHLGYRAICGGEPVFRGTRVPVETLISNLEAGVSLDEFLDNFPTVTREQALQVLEFSKSTILKLRKTA